jgi:hypothetical protein
MLDHHIQRQIVYRLAFVDSLRFGELKPDELENKLFTYHLKKVVAAGLVIKQEDGSYTLTSEGRRVGKGALERERKYIDSAYSIILIALQKDDAWLLYKRYTHPLIGLYGFMQAKPTADTTILETATTTCLKETGLSATFAPHSSGYFRMYRNTELESFIHFTLVVGTNIQGDLRQNTEFGEYEWIRSPDFAASDMLPNMRTLYKMCESPAGSFVDETFQL